MDSLASTVAAVTASLDEATTEQLAMSAAAGLVGLYLLPSLLPLLLLAGGTAGLAYAYAVAPVAAGFASLGAVTASILVYAAFTVNVFKVWEQNFAGVRLTRRATACPSNQKLPDIRSLETNKARILENAKFHEGYDDSELLHSVADMEVTRKENREFRKRATRLGTLTPAKAALLQENLDDEQASSLGTGKAKELDMDHIFVKFADFLWGYTFISPSVSLGCAVGTMVLCIRKGLYRMGLINPKCDYDALVAACLLEQTQVIHYYGRTKEDSKLGNVAGFFFADFPWVDENCDAQIADLFSVEIDLDTKRFVTAKLDGEILTSKEAFILLWFNTVGAQHVKLHAMANWGLNLDDSLKGVNSFLRRNSIVTVMYNFFGYTSFDGYTVKTWSKLGLVSEGWTKPSSPVTQTFNRGIKDNVWAHPQIEELVKYSRLVKFIVKVRSIFMAEFKKHKDLFPGVDGEAMFIGTVLHSLDHTLMEWNLKDPLYLDTADPRFGKMAEIIQFIRVSFVSDIHGLYFHKRFKGSGHPFYDAVYEKAAKVDKFLADYMDTCIVK